MRPLRLAILACLLIPQAACGDSLPQQLATIQAGHRVDADDITVARFRSLLKQLTATYVEPEQKISDMTVKVQELLKEEGIDQKPLQIMEGMNQLFSQKVENQKYLEYVTFYMLGRKKGQTHEQALASIKATLAALGIH